MLLNTFRKLSPLNIFLTKVGRLSNGWGRRKIRSTARHRGDGADIAGRVNWIAATLFGPQRRRVRSGDFEASYGRKLARENVELTTLYSLTPR